VAQALFPVLRELALQLFSQLQAAQAGMGMPAPPASRDLLAVLGAAAVLAMVVSSLVEQGRPGRGIMVAYPVAAVIMLAAAAALVPLAERVQPVGLAALD
jgi:hypothetical protein